MNRRVFTLVEGVSSKFWAITLDGAAHTVEYGRIGTNGQSGRKDFGSEAEAKASADKLVAEKLRKGYAEQADGASPPVSATTPPAPKPKAKAKAKPETGLSPVPDPTPSPTPEPEPESLVMAERRLDLEPEDWCWTIWDSHRFATRREPKPFDRDEAMGRLAKAASSDQSYHWHWNQTRLTTNPSDEEARFWLTIFAQFQHSDVPRSFLAKFRERSPGFYKMPGFAKVAAKWDEVGHSFPIEFTASIFRAYPFEECLDYWTENIPGPQSYMRSRENQKLAEGFRRYVRPFLDADRLAAMRDQVRSRLPIPALPPDQYSGFPMAWYLASSLGLADEVAGLLRIIPDGHYAGKDNYAEHYQRPQWLVLGLGDPGKIESKWRRLKISSREPEEVRAWLATTGFAALDVPRDGILAASKKEDAQAMTHALGRAKGPEVAPIMLELVAASKGPRPAAQWLDENPAFAIAGLIETAGGKGKLADAALEFLRLQKKKGRADFLTRCLASAPAEAAAKVRREVLDREEVEVEELDDASTPEAIRAAVAEMTGSKLPGWTVAEMTGAKAPGWVALEALPKVLVGGRALAEGQVSALLAGLAKSTLDKPAAIVAAVREHADRRSLDAFAWALFERWQREGSPSKEKWALLAIGLLGSDGSALKLTPLIRAWPGESQHARAVIGLECLRAIGTDGAMMQLNGIAQKLSFKGLKAKAAAMMEAIAEDRKMTRAQLEDRIVPDCDLDERGSRVFDFGPRQFTFVLGGEMKPMVRDAEGKLKPDLPKPNAKDDPALASAAIDNWKLLKKQIREVVKLQADRLEQAMVIGRRWSVADFESLLVRHPLMINLVRMVVWGGYDAEGNLAKTFRVTDERDYADAYDAATSLDGVASVGVVHPLHLSPAEASAWGEIFGDYEIIPPFPQLGRPVHRLDSGEEKATDLKGRVAGKLPAITLVGLLDRHGWTRGMPQDAGIFCEHVKPFEGAGVTAVIQYDGIPIGYMDGWDDQAIEGCYFVRGIYTPRDYPDPKKAIALGRVDPVVISEVLATLGVLASKVI